MTGDLRESVAACLSRGWHIVPVAARSKRPIVQDWPVSATNDPDQVAGWAEHNLAVVMGPSGLAVVDIDGEDGEVELARVLSGVELPPTPEVRTSRGRHLYFLDAGGLTKSAAGGLDLQVGRALVLIPPSVHPDGTPYRWAGGRDPAAVEVAPMPEALVEHFRQRSSAKGPATAGRVPEGRRNVTLTSIAGRLRAQGRGEEAIATELSAVNQKRCEPPLPDKEVAGIAKSVAKYPAGGGSEADRLIAFARANYDLAVDEQNEAVAIPRRGPRIALGLSADHHGLGAALRFAAVEMSGRAPTQTTMAVVIATAEAYARLNPRRRVPLRVARPARDTLVIDLGRADGVCVIVDPEGWRRVEGPPEPVVFRRTLLTLPLPEPEAGEDIAALRDLINVADADWPLLVVWMVAALMEDVPTPILLLTGEQGTGKSTAAKLLALLLDPSGAPLRSPPRNLEDWAVAAAGSWLVVLDNLSRIDERLMDALCRAVTGDALVRRALYTNSDVNVLAFRRKIALTTIDPGAVRGDLVERLLVIDLARITSTRRRTEAELMEAFEDLRPRLLGGLLDLVAKVLAVLPEVRVPEPPRMADFAHIAAAVDHVLQTRALELYIARGREITADVLDTDPVLGAVRRLMETLEKWEGTPAALLGKLEGQIGTGDTPKGWPTTAAALGKRLRNASRALGAVGIDLHAGRTQKGRTYTLTRIHPDNGST